MIRGHTHEAGVRKLEQLVASVSRKRARQLAGGAEGRLVVTPSVVSGLLGPVKFRIESQVHERTKRPGVAVALAWTPHGGEVLYVESSKLGRGKGAITLT